MHGVAMVSWLAWQRSRTVHDPVEQPMPAWHPSHGVSRSVVRARTVERGRGGIGFPPTAPVLCFLNAEEGTKEGDDEGVPPVSQHGERRRCGGVRAGCVGRARSGQACLWLCMGQQRRARAGSWLLGCYCHWRARPRRWTGHKLGQMAFPFSSSISFLFFISFSFLFYLLPI